MSDPKWVSGPSSGTSFLDRSGMEWSGDLWMRHTWDNIMITSKANGKFLALKMILYFINKEGKMGWKCCIDDNENEMFFQQNPSVASSDSDSSWLIRACCCSLSVFNWSFTWLWERLRREIVKILNILNKTDLIILPGIHWRQKELKRKIQAAWYGPYDMDHMGHMTHIVSPWFISFGLYGQAAG